jgi:hypothetical protein
MNPLDEPAMRGTNEPEKVGGDPPSTPLGYPVVSRHAALSERIREDWKVHGHESHLPSSAYRLQALYLDFGHAAPAEELAASILRLLDDPRNAARPLVADPRLLEAERQSFGDLLDEDLDRVRQRVERLTRRALVAALVFNAHFWNVRLALQVVGGAEPLEGASLGTCRFVAERRVGRSLAGDLHYYSPLREPFCTDHCLPAIGPRPTLDRPCLPARTPADCGMLRILEGFRFFASFPDE